MDNESYNEANVGTELLFANGNVRVWELRLKPGEASPPHRHYCDYIIAYSSPLEGELLLDDEVSSAQYDAGYVAYVPVAKDGSELQQLVNRSDREHSHFVVELIGTNLAAPRLSNGRERPITNGRA